MPSEVIPYSTRVENWNRLIKCPKCSSRDIDGKGKKYTCRRCGFSLDKPRCKHCKGVRMFVANIEPRVEITFRCIDCKNDMTIKVK